MVLSRASGLVCRGSKTVKEEKKNKRKININTQRHSSIKERRLAVALSKLIARDH